MKAKHKLRLRLPSPAMIVALFALFIALGGSTYAAVKINGKNLQNNSVSAKKLTKKLRQKINQPGASVRITNKPIKEVRVTKSRTIEKEGGVGPTGPEGAPGESAVKTITTSTAVSNWPESSGWATDQFTRVLTLTRSHAAPSEKCGGTPTCWFYTGTLADNGSFTTVDGHASPNTSSSSTINGELTGSMVGEVDLEFYASSGEPDASLVPAEQEYEAGVVSTSGWAKLAFPSGTAFAGVSLSAYKWVYSLGCSAQTWTDQINPGDDGQSPADGNITGPCS